MQHRKRINMFLICCLSFALLPTHSLAPPPPPGVERSPIVTLEEGRVRGKGYHLAHLNLSGDVFYGIPFAEPPVGSLRFRRPVPVKKWSRVRNATDPPDSCYQVPDTFFGPDFYGSTMWNSPTPLSEDCLYVNVWVPHTNPPTNLTHHPTLGSIDPLGYRGHVLRARPKRAVMLWIYGGGYYSGSTTLHLYDARILASLNDVIVVSIAYRVGAFGFLCLDSASAPCNVGLYDQLAGLDWARRNVRYFGGDPDRVTLFGESAGSASVSLHLLSPLSTNHFHRAILQSGVANMPWAVTSPDEGRRRSAELALEYLHCETSRNDWEGMAECLREVPAQRLVDLQWVSRDILQFPFLPVIDGVFLPEDPVNALRNGHFKRCPILLGSNLNEASWFIIYELHVPDKLDLHKQSMSRADYIDSMKKLFFRYPQYPQQLNNNFALSAIQFQYTDWLAPNDTESNLKGLDAAVSDFQFLCPLNEFALKYASHSSHSSSDGPQVRSQAGVWSNVGLGWAAKEQGKDPTYEVFTYYFTQRYSSNPWPEWMGVLHGDDILFMFGEPLKLGANFTEDERQLTRDMMRYWTNFAKSGNPNKVTKDQKTAQSLGLNFWPSHSVINREYLELNSKFISTRNDPSSLSPIGQGPRTNQCAFWNMYIPNLLLTTAGIGEEEQLWKLEFEEWAKKYIQDWKSVLQFGKELRRNCSK